MKKITAAILYNYRDRRGHVVGAAERRTGAEIETVHFDASSCGTVRMEKSGVQYSHRIARRGAGAVLDYVFTMCAADAAAWDAIRA